MPAHITPRRTQLFLPLRWLISPRIDTVWLLGSVLVSYGLFLAWRQQWISTIQLILLWVFAFHGPHFWGTISRTFLDTAEWGKRGPLLRKSLLWFLVGPLFVGGGLLLQPLMVAAGLLPAGSLTASNHVVMLFFFLASLWAYHHVVKQHFGFVALYRARHGELDRRETWLYKNYLVVSLWIPVVMVFATTVHWLQEVPLVRWAYLQQGWDPRPIGALITAVCRVMFWVLQAAFVGYLASRYLNGRPINLPATLIILACVPLHWLVINAALDVSEVGDPIAAYAFVPLTTIYHNMQYQGLVWHYNTIKYRRPGAAAEHGLAATLNKNLPVYLGCGLLYTVVTIGTESYGIYDADAMNRATSTLGPLVASAIWGFSFMHYYLDRNIWKVREDADLRRVLGLSHPPDMNRATVA